MKDFKTSDDENIIKQISTNREYHFVEFTGTFPCSHCYLAFMFGVLCGNKCGQNPDNPRKDGKIGIFKRFAGYNSTDKIISNIIRVQDTVFRLDEIKVAYIQKLALERGYSFIISTSQQVFRFDYSLKEEAIKELERIENILK